VGSERALLRAPADGYHGATAVARARSVGGSRAGVARRYRFRRPWIRLAFGCRVSQPALARDGRSDGADCYLDLRLPDAKRPWRILSRRIGFIEGRAARIGGDTASASAVWATRTC